MSKPVHTLVAYFDDGQVLRRPWRVRQVNRFLGDIVPADWKRRDGPTTDEQLALWADHDFWAADTGSLTHCVERAVIVRPITYRTSRGQTRVVMAESKPKLHVVAKYLRSTQPTNDQTRLIERIIAKPAIIQAFCEPQSNGDVIIKTYDRLAHRRPDTIVYRHPTIKELIYGETS